ncbi:hypothetical protein STEG23_020527 [Scotinomys teguina]
MEVVAAAPRCQLLLIMLMAAMLLPGMKVSPLLVRRKIARTIELQENIGKGQFGEVCTHNEYGTLLFPAPSSKLFGNPGQPEEENRAVAMACAWGGGIESQEQEGKALLAAAAKWRCMFSV